MASSSSINSELVAKIRTCLEARLTELQAEQDAIYSASSAEYNSHSDMAIDDMHWDDLDRKILKTEELIKNLGGLEKALNEGELSEEVKERFKRVLVLVEKLLPLLPAAPAGAEGAPSGFEEDDETNAWDDEEQQDDCRYCSGCYYCRESGGFDLADEI